MQAIGAMLTQWLEANRESLRGPKGDKGDAGLPGMPGQGQAIDYDVLAAEVANRLKPIYIGAKDFQGNITMSAAPVSLGDTVYIRVDPPKLTDTTNTHAR